MATDTPIGTRISKRRHVLGITQRDLAARLGVSPSTVANWETGKHFPRRYLGKVEDVLGISLENDEPPRRVLSRQLRREIAEILEGDEETRRRVIDLLEGTTRQPGDG